MLPDVTDITEHKHWDAFVEFNHENPHVYDRLVELTREWVAAGHERCAIGMLWEVLRWRSGLDVEQVGEFKLNDHFRSLYVRMMMDLEPDLDGVFEVRALRAS